jgi:hypothetical protein
MGGLVRFSFNYLKVIPLARYKIPLCFAIGADAINPSFCTYKIEAIK